MTPPKTAADFAADPHVVAQSDAYAAEPSPPLSGLAELLARLERDELREANKIYEAVDVTGEEMYYTVGFFRTFDEACAAMERQDEPPADDPQGEPVTVEIRPHKFGYYGPCYSSGCVARFTWRSDYDEEKDEYRWTREREILSGCGEMAEPMPLGPYELAALLAENANLQAELAQRNLPALPATTEGAK